MAISFGRATKSDENVGVDRVTGALNRRQLDMDLAVAAHSCGLPTVLLEIDIDSFERFGRRRGAASADQVLERLGCVLMTARASDRRHLPSSARELLHASMVSDAKTVAERICSNIESTLLLAGKM